jgi:hypothetical protein
MSSESEVLGWVRVRFDGLTALHHIPAHSMVIGIVLLHAMAHVRSLHWYEVYMSRRLQSTRRERAKSRSAAIRVQRI